MAVTLEFRPVVFGDLDRPTIVAWLDEVDGQTYFHDGNFSWPVETVLEQAQVSDLPEAWTSQDVPIALLPVETACGTDEEEAFEGLLLRLEALHARQPAATATS